MNTRDREAFAQSTPAKTITFPAVVIRVRSHGPAMVHALHRQQSRWRRLTSAWGNHLNRHRDAVELYGGGFVEVGLGPVPMSMPEELAELIELCQQTECELQEQWSLLRKQVDNAIWAPRSDAVHDRGDVDDLDATANADEHTIAFRFLLHRFDSLDGPDRQALEAVRYLAVDFNRAHQQSLRGELVDQLRDEVGEARKRIMVLKHQRARHDLDARSIEHFLSEAWAALSSCDIPEAEVLLEQIETCMYDRDQIPADVEEQVYLALEQQAQADEEVDRALQQSEQAEITALISKALASIEGCVFEDQLTDQLRQGLPCLVSSSTHPGHKLQLLLYANHELAATHLVDETQASEAPAAYAWGEEILLRLYDLLRAGGADVESP